MYPLEFSWKDQRLAIFTKQTKRGFKNFATDLGLPLGTFKQYAGGYRKVALNGVLRILHLYRNDSAKLAVLMKYFVWEAGYYNATESIEVANIAANGERDTAPVGLFIEDQYLISRFVRLVRRRVAQLNRDQFSVLTGVSRFSIKNHELGLRAVTSELFFQTLLLLENPEVVMQQLLNLCEPVDLIRLIGTLKLDERAKARVAELPPLSRKDRIKEGAL